MLKLYKLLLQEPYGIQFVIKIHALLQIHCLSIHSIWSHDLHYHLYKRQIIQELQPNDNWCADNYVDECLKR